MELQTVIKPYSKKELCVLYNVSYATLSAWLKPVKDTVGKYTGKCYTIRQVRIIFEFLGEP